MDRLSQKVFERILWHLHPWDRLNCALTCRSWANCVHSAALLEDIWLVIIGFESYTVARAVIQSQRQYRNLRIIRASLSSFNPDFWVKIGQHLRRLELIDCTVSPNDFNLILRHCPGLESLTLQGRLVWKLVYPKGQDPSGAREALPNVQLLRLDIPLKAETLDELLTLMPKTTFLSFKLRRFPQQAPYLLPCMRKTQQMYTKLAFYLDLSDDQVIELVSTYSGSLQELRLGCGLLTRQAFEAIGTCKELRRLCLRGAYQFGDSHLETLIRNASDLACLTLSSCDSVTEASLTHLHDLGKLRHLALESCLRVTNDALCDFKDIPTLRSLQLKLSRVDIGALKYIACLKDLRILVLSCDITVDGLNMICELLERLEVLELGNCERLSDSEGMKFARLKHLKSLKFRNGTGFTDRTFENGVGSSSVESLTLDGCLLTDVGLASIVTHHGRLASLQLSDCDKITDLGLASLFRGEPFLSTLALIDCKRLTQWCVEELEHSCPRLRFINLSLYRGGKRAAEQLERDRPDIKVRLGFSD